MLKNHRSTIEHVILIASVTVMCTFFFIMPTIPATPLTMMIVIAIQILLCGVPLGYFTIRVVNAIMAKFALEITSVKIIIVKIVVGVFPIVCIISYLSSHFPLNPSAIDARFFELSISLFAIVVVNLLIWLICNRFFSTRTICMKDYIHSSADSLIGVVIGFIPMSIIIVLVSLRMHSYETWSPLDVYFMERGISNVTQNTLFYIMVSVPVVIGSTIASFVSIDASPAL